MTRDSILEIQEKGYCVLKQHFARPLIDTCGDGSWPILLGHIEARGSETNRGPHRHFLPMPFEPPCFRPEFFFDNEVLNIVRGAMDDRAI